METLQISVLTFQFQFFFLLFFPFDPSIKDQFDSNCNNLGTYLIEIFRNLGFDLINFIARIEYKDVWHKMTNYFN